MFKPERICAFDSCTVVHLQVQPNLDGTIPSVSLKKIVKSRFILLIRGPLITVDIIGLFKEIFLNRDPTVHTYVRTFAPTCNSISIVSARTNRAGNN